MKRNLLPPLYGRHRGFAITAMAIAYVHLVGAADGLLPRSANRHTGPVWTVAIQLAPGVTLGIIHLILFLAIITGLYWPNPSLLVLRLGCALSATVYMMLACSWGLAAIQHWPRVSFFGVGTSAGLSIVCIAAVLEPGVQRAHTLQSAEADGEPNIIGVIEVKDE